MSLQILINNNTGTRFDYITWTPTPCSIVSNESTSRKVLIKNKNTSKGGQIVFSSGLPFNPQDTLLITVPFNGSLDFFIAGKFNSQSSQSFPSTDDKDAVIQISDANDNSSLGEKALMVRVRKNANGLSPSERDRFLDAMVKLNQAGQFIELQNMHIEDNLFEIHGRSCFLPWHRAFLLDLERRLQEINPAVTIPYWKFDEKAPRVFIRDFIGVPDLTGMVEFSNTNPLINWRLQLFGVGINQRVRRNYADNFNPAVNRAIINNDENQTLGLGNVFSIFARQPNRTNSSGAGGIERDPHGSAHVSFTGQLSNIGRAPADPLFFLLHCNVDRLWAKWQWIKDKFQPTNVDAYQNQGNGNPMQGGELGIGNFSNDSMWPWNKVTGSNSSGSPRPPHAPGDGMPASPLTNFPGKQPTIAGVIDYHGQISLSNNLHVAYDDIPFEL